MTDVASLDQQFSTPMMQQYLALKREYPDCILLFRLGDFYEMFLDDALLGASILGITLTSRTRGKDGRIPMAGVPYHAVEGYVAKLLAAGHKVAMCDQMTPPKAGELVERTVTKVLTPGTVVSDHLLHATQSAVVGVAVVTGNSVGIALADVAEGSIYANNFSFSDTQLIGLLNTLSTLFDIREWLLKDSTPSVDSVLRQWLEMHPEITITHPSLWPQKPHTVNDCIQPVFPPTAPHYTLLDNSSTASAVAIVLEYLRYTQKTLPSHCHLVPLLADTYLQLDAASIHHLEVIPDHPNATQPTLYSLLNQTTTAAGSRLLRHWLLRPLADTVAIEQRQSAVAFFCRSPLLLPSLRAELQRVLDIERLIARLTLQSGSPRDVVALAQSLTAADRIVELLQQHQLPNILSTLTVSDTLRTLAKRISQVLIDEPPLDPRQGGLLKTGCHPQLDQWRTVANNQRQLLSDLEQSLRQTTTISSLKVRYNQVFGFYIEVSKSNVHLVPAHFVRKQTLVNAERFTTSELSESEAIIVKAEADSAELEYQLFLELVQEVLTQTIPLQHLAAQLAELDCLQSLAMVAQTHNYTAPKITTTGHLKLIASRHPVLETLPHITSFVPNDLELNHQDQQLILLTGPNMAGKSVLMRQVALITLMAHIGSYVPATEALIPLTDRIFVRSGAGDAMTRGLSTFMVEMVETADILHHATERSLVIMDEIGRGTSTHDGISLAWAIAEHLVTTHQPGPLTLFATHYHELQELAGCFPDKIKNYHLAITEHETTLVFLYTVQAGGASQSHGLKVAELAGVPSSVVARAREKLKSWENPAPPPSAQQTRVHTDVESVITRLRHLEPTEITPLQALITLSELHQQLIQPTPPTA